MSLEFVAVVLASSSGSRLFPLTVDAHDDGHPETTKILDLDEEEEEEDDDVEDEDDEKEEEGVPNTQQVQESAMVSFMPKHLLPIAGSPIIFHLLRRLHTLHFTLVLLTLSTHDEDTMTLRALTEPSLGFGATIIQTVPHSDDGTHIILDYQNMKIHVVRLNVECTGSADVLRILSSPNRATGHVLLPQHAHIMVLPGDLFLAPPPVIMADMNTNDEDSDPIILLADAHRKAAFPIHFSHPQQQQQQQQQHYGIMKNGMPHMSLIPPPPTAALTMLLTNVGEEDESGIPLKESAKMKKGGLAREDQDMDYIALAHIQHLHLIPTLTAATVHSTTMAMTHPIRSISTSSFAPIPSFATRAVPQRVVLKTSKVAIEEDEENTGSTPKLCIPKARFHSSYNRINQIMTPSAKSSFSIRNDWSDIHAYVFSPWIIHLLHARPTIKDVQKELIPLLISRQFKGVRATFLGTSSETVLVDKEDRKTILDQILAQDPTFQYNHNSSSEERNHHLQNPVTKEDGRKNMSTVHSTSSFTSLMIDNTSISPVHHIPNTNPTLRDDQQVNSFDFQYLVNAQVLPRSTSKLTLRACTIPSYLYACREMASRCCLIPDVAVNIKSPTSPTMAYSSYLSVETLPKGTVIDRKTQSILLPDVLLADKVQIKSCTLGYRSKIGAKSRLNNVVVMDDVVIGENCVLQNSVISSNCIIGENSNLNDCQVGPKAIVQPGTKAKGESFT